ncbi:MAG: ACP S-malonyltransferase [Elusimicrobiota bacterium]|nr:ACP S-malonyltransferase [Elusimicrobiota bacterium]MDH5662344.1 ACP S-malonyltransferase [Elusimicrobiota bacterium]
MVKAAFLFPGQGSQYVGMGRELYEKYEPARKIIDRANDILGYDLRKKIFYGPEQELQQTLITQPAVFTVSVACLEVLQRPESYSSKEILKPQITAGHSLGEYTALVAAGVFDFPQALSIVQKRAEFIQRASREKPGTMAAVIGLEKEKLEEVIEDVKGEEVLAAVNFNSPHQIVIAGELKAIERAVQGAKAKGAKRAIILKVSGAFHSPLMAQAGKSLAGELQNYELKDPVIPVVTNYNAKPATSREEIRKALVSQIDSPVLWEDSIREMLQSGVEIFIEVGPGEVLTGLLSRINKEASGLNVEDERSLQETLKKLETFN